MAMPHTLNAKAADPASIARALADNAEHVFIEILGNPSSRSRREYRWRTHGSLAGYLTPPKRGRWSDFESGERGDCLDLIARERGISLGAAIDVAKREFLGDLLSTPVRREAVPKIGKAEDDNARTAAAQRHWREAGPITGTLAERYFIEHRMLDVRLLDLDHALRWHAGIRAVVALMTDPVSGDPTGIHRTFLHAGGAKIDRKMLGRQGVIRLSPDDAVTISLGITEGVEDGIAVLLSAWGPAWVATSAGAIARFPPLAGIEALTIFADADEAGQLAADTCVKRWLAQGRDARIAAPGGLA
jgi:hypothetical protein